MTRDDRQDLVIERWKKAKCRATLVAGTGFGINQGVYANIIPLYTVFIKYSVNLYIRLVI